MTLWFHTGFCPLSCPPVSPTHGEILVGTSFWLMETQWVALGEKALRRNKVVA